jgi:protein-tyrosine-phosphatase/DNA-binding transcriptional ArsR family regulator
MYSAGMVKRAAPQVPSFIRLAANPLRWRLLVELEASDQRVRELVECLGEPQNLVSYHLRLLRDGGLVRARRSSYDGRDTYYHLDLDRCADGLSSAGAALHPGLRITAPPPDQPSAGVPRVLFVCTGNSARSPIAEALLRHHSGGRITVASAGVVPKSQLHPHAVRVLHERFAIEVQGQKPRAIGDLVAPASVAAFDRVVTLCDRAREQLPEHHGGPRTHWSVPDPTDAPGRAQYASFVATATDIDARVRHLIPTLDRRRQSP